MWNSEIVRSTSATPLPTNLLQHSQAFDLWTPLGGTIVQNVANDLLKGAAVVDRFVEQAAGVVQHSLTAPSIIFTSGITYTFSVYAKYETAAFIQLLFGSLAFGFNAWGNFDIQKGTVETMGSAATGAITDVGNGWYRISITATAMSSAVSGIVIFGANSGTMSRALSYPGSTSNTRLLADAQVEMGSRSSRLRQMENRNAEAGAVRRGVAGGGLARHR
jgi:hypothetical protein